MLIIAGVTISSLSETGLIGKAILAKEMQEEAELLENIKIILNDASIYNQDGEKEQEQVKIYISKKFKNQKLKASIGLYEDGYVLIYGIKNKKIMYLDESLIELKTEVAVIGTDKEWDYIVNDDNSATLVTYKLAAKGEINIPNIIDDYLVTGIGDSVFNYATNITKITLPQGLKSIGNKTFAFCSNLEWNIEFPETVETIGDMAFYGCTKITGNLDELMKLNVKYGKGVYMKCSSLTGNIQTLMDMLDESETVISESTFSGFSGATGVLVIPERITSIENNAFYGCSGISGIVFESNKNLKNIGSDAFYQCSGITGSLDVPDSVETIGDRAFYQNSSVNSLDLPSGLKDLGEYAFYQCTNIGGTVTFGANLSEIKQQTFRECKKLDKIIFLSNGSSGVKQIKKWSFSSCSRLKNIEFPNTLVNIETFSFYCDTNMCDISFPDNLNIIGANTFNSCSKLNIIKWPLKLKNIGNSAFANCTKISKLPNNKEIVYLGESCFSGDKLIGSIGENDIIKWIQNSKLSVIEDSAFKDCEKLIGDYVGEVYNIENKKININGSPFTGTQVQFAKILNLEGRTEIKDREFSSVTKFIDENQNEITDIIIPDTVTKIGSSAFSGCTSITSVTIADSVETIDKLAFSNCTNLSKIKLPNNEKYYKISERLLFGCINLKTIEIPKGITTIDNYALMNCDFNNLVIPGNVKNIGAFALAGNYNLTKLTLEEGIEVLGTQFLNGTAIMELIIPNSVSQLSSASFYSLKNLKNLTIGKGVTKITSNLLSASNNVESITIKGKVTDIGDSAFIGLSKLTKLDMDWSNVVKIDSNAFRNCSALTGNVKLNANCKIAEDAFLNCKLNVSK